MDLDLELHKIDEAFSKIMNPEKEIPIIMFEYSKWFMNRIIKRRIIPVVKYKDRVIIKEKEVIKKVVPKTFYVIKEKVKYRSVVSEEEKHSIFQQKLKSLGMRYCNDCKSIFELSHFVINRKGYKCKKESSIKAARNYQKNKSRMDAIAYFNRDGLSVKEIPPEVLELKINYNKLNLVTNEKRRETQRC